MQKTKESPQYSGVIMKIVKLNVNDRLEMKKYHPCGGNLFKILRVGSDVRVVCEKCGHDMTLDRVKLEKAIKKIIPTESEKNNNV